MDIEFDEVVSKNIILKKGLNIKLEGKADKVYAATKPPKSYAIKPTDFHNLTPKLAVKETESVLAGDCIFFDKYNESIKICSPVSGSIKAIVRGEKRKILQVVIDTDSEIKYKNFNVNKSESRDDIIASLLDSGLWPFLRQKPYDIIANPEDNPKAIFISSFSSSPLSTDNDFALYGLDELFQLGLDKITKLTTGITHLNVDGNTIPSKVFTSAKGVQINKVSGPHPSGNVGIQIHHIDPINKGDVVWYLNPQDVISIGRLFHEGKADFSRIVSLSGSMVSKPRYYRMVAGACIFTLLENNVHEGEKRIISGDVLTGKKISEEGYLGFYDTQICVIPEGNTSEFLGWLLPGFHKFSMSKTFFSWLFPNKRFNLNTNNNGEERAFVVTGQYEKVLPMNIFPMQLIKSIMMEDIEMMEGLGIYEVSTEDFALCEFVCTSKMDVQNIIRKGLDLMLKENS